MPAFSGLNIGSGNSIAPRTPRRRSSLEIIPESIRYAAGAPRRNDIARQTRRPGETTVAAAIRSRNDNPFNIFNPGLRLRRNIVTNKNEWR